MSGSVNKVILLGNLGKDPELKYIPNGSARCVFSIATNKRWKDKDNGQWQERTSWHNIVAWGKVAENASKYLKKGRQVYLEGELQTRKWTAQDNTDRWTTEVVVITMVLLQDGKGRENAPPPEEQVGMVLADGTEGAAESSTIQKPAPQTLEGFAQDAFEYGPPPSTMTDEDIPF